MAPAPRCLTALPVFNEVTHLNAVLDQVLRHACTVLVVDDGSTDGSSELLAKRDDVIVVRHPENRGYGAALCTAFRYAVQHEHDVLITIDCDGQHEPQLISELARAVFTDDDGPVDLVSGSRYLAVDSQATSQAPADRRRINQVITGELNDLFGLSLTDAFCGFKAYRVESLPQLRLTEPGYAMPLELWVQAARLGWRVREAPVPLIYLDEERSFGGSLDEAETRLAYYRDVISRAVAADLGPVGAGQDCVCLTSGAAVNPEPC